MQNFTFHNPTRILFGKGRIADIAREIPAGARVLITYGGGSVVSTGTLDEVTAALKGFTLFEFAGIEANPTYETLMQAVDLARREKIDFLLAVGGGSVIDAPLPLFAPARIHVLTDRPLYELGNTVQFRMADVKYVTTDGQWVIATSTYDTRSTNQGGILLSTNDGASWYHPASTLR